jgi:hypothetical protein
VGSVLPSDDGSVRTAPPQPSRGPRPPIITIEEVTNRGTGPAVSSRPASPEVVLNVVPSKWRFDETKNAEGVFQSRGPAEQTTLQDMQPSSKETKYKPYDQDTTIFRSRFFPARIPSPDLPPPSPLRVPDMNESLQELPAEQPMIHTGFVVSPYDGPHRDASRPFEVAKDDPPYIAHGPLSDGCVSPEEHIIPDGATGGLIYEQNHGLTVAHFIDDQLGPEYSLNTHADDLLDTYGDEDPFLDARPFQELVEGRDLRQGICGPMLQRDDEYCDLIED